MREPPDLPAATIIRALRASYGIEVAALEFLPVGNDAASWAYRVAATPGPTYFLKVRAGAGRAPGAEVPDHLRRQRVPNVPAPLPTGAGRPWVDLDRFALTLYPMIDGRTGAEAGLSAEQWRELGAATNRVHAVPLPPGLARRIGRESFRPAGRQVVADLEPLMTRSVPSDPLARELAAVWRARRDVIGALVDQVDAIGRQLERSSFPLVLCHGDLHTWNVLVDAHRRLWIVDWDEAVLAPKERDLMFVVGGIVHGLVKPQDTEAFLEGYGETTVDQRLLAYYRHAWAVQEIVIYGEEVALSPTLGEETRRAALDGFRELFEPGNIVDLARASTTVLEGQRRAERPL